MSRHSLLGICCLVLVMRPVCAVASPTVLDDFYTPTATVFSVAAPGVLANDTSSGGALSVVVANITGLKGTLSPKADGSFTFTPQAGLATNTGFSYTIQDELGRVSSASVTFDMVSTLPDAIDDLYRLFADEVLSIDPVGVLANDLGGLGALHVAVVDITGLAGSLFALADGSFRYTPSTGFFGTTSFDYVLRDDLGRTSRATVDLIVDRAGTIPEPATVALLGLGLFGLGFFRRKG